VDLADADEINLVEAIWGPDLAAVTDERLAVVDLTGGEPRRWTRRDLAAAAAGVAARVRGARTVGLVLENCAEFVAAFHGVLAAGAVVLPLDPRATPESWAAVLGARGVDVVVAGARQRALLPADVTVVEVGDGPEPGGSSCPVPAGGTRTAVLASSSGTQGKPKLVVVTHRNLVANLVQIAGVHVLTGDDVVLAVTPLRHIYGMQMAMNNALLTGAPIVVAPTPLRGAAALLDLVAEHGVTVAYLVPSVVAELAALGRTSGGTALKLVVSGGAPLAVATARECSAALGVPVVQGLGMTEAGCVCFTPDGVPGPPDTVGVPLPGTEVRFVDPATGADAVPGELWIRGPQVTPGYLDDPGATAALIDADGWLHSGDLAELDDDGYLRIVGRLKSMIKYKGHQVAPAELEDLLTTHPAVTDAAVIGEPDPVAGELPRAFVVLAEPVPLAEVVEHVAARVPPHKRIRLIERVRVVPRSATGKVVRAELVAGPLRGLSVVVTGGGRGLGRVFASAVAHAGADVLVTGRDESVLKATAAELADGGGRVSWAVADVLDPEATRRAVEDFGDVDVLVNNAALPGPIGPMWTVEPDEWWHAVEVTVRGTMSTTRAVLPGMIARGGGRVIGIVSNAGRTRWPHASAYSVAKAAQIKLVENLASELRGTGVAALAFDPGLLDEGMTRAHFERGRTGERWADTIHDWALEAKEAGRFANADDAAAHLVHLAAGFADHLSGRYLTGDDLDPPHGS
jgi:acyl-CoA synthetase (AMP-forming)/AMP-acid ligase II/NAD(P)-dependent dehydrogenase (short-subunit alcohol dehydrogenase family)